MHEKCFMCVFSVSCCTSFSFELAISQSQYQFIYDTIVAFVGAFGSYSNFS